MAESQVGRVDAGREGARTAMVASFIGNSLEWYDFFIYAVASALVFNKLFFPTEHPLAGTLLAFATFGVGYAARPLGGVLCGHFGDRIGRKNILAVTLVAMGASTFLIGLLPTYETIGIWAPALLVVLRLVQGLSAGGEYGGAVLIAVEKAPPGRRGFVGAWPMAGVPIGLFFANGAFLLLGFLNESAFQAWGWRIPFLASLLLIVVGIITRLRLTETHDFRQAREAGMTVKVPLVQVVRQRPLQLLTSAGLSIGFNTFSWTVISFAVFYTTDGLGLSRDVMLGATLIGAALMAGSILYFGGLSDRIGRHRVIAGGAAFLTIYTIPLFQFIETRNVVLITVTVAVAWAGAGALFGPMGTYTAEAFGAHNRYTGLSLGYQGGAVLGGGVAPALATALYASHGIFSVSLYLTLGAAISLVSVFALRRLQIRDPENSTLWSSRPERPSMSFQESPVVPND